MQAVMPLTPFTYKMCAKLEEEGLQCPLLSMYVDTLTKKHVHLLVLTSKKFYNQREKHVLNRNKNHPLPEPQLSS
jgi:hypothetical protein